MRNKLEMCETWLELDDVCIDDDDCIDEDFLHFEAGTEITEIWHWFEDKFDVSIAELDRETIREYMEAKNESKTI